MNDTAPAAVTAETSTQTYLISEQYLSKLTNTLDKLARKAQRLGTTTISYTVGAVKDLPYRKDREDGYIKIEKEADLLRAKEDKKLVYFRFHEVTVTGTTPRLAGWQFVATLQHFTAEGGEVINLLRVVPSFEGDLPVQYRTATPENCDHCHKAIRTRQETFIVRHEDGTWKQVGRNCTQDFLGNKNPQAVAAALELLLRTFSECEAGEEGFGGGFGGGSLYRYAIDEFLAVVAMFVRVDGWVSRGKARIQETLTATADSTLSYLQPPRDGRAYEQWKQWVNSLPVKDEDREVAQKALDHARDVLGAKQDRSDYEHNLYVATIQASVDHSLAGIAASLIAYYLKEVERRVIKEAELRLVGDSKFMGTVGEKLTLTDVLVAKIIPISSDFGTKYLHKLITAEGNSVVWFNSGTSDNNLKAGEKYTIRGTVKEHKEYQGVKQTTLLRVKALSPEELAKEQKKAERAAKKAAKAAEKAQEPAGATESTKTEV